MPIETLRESNMKALIPAANQVLRGEGVFPNYGLVQGADITPGATSVLLSRNVLGSAAASVTFSSISQAYTALLLLFEVRLSSAVTSASMIIRVGNGTPDSTTIYESLYIYGAGTVGGSGQNIAVANWVLSTIPGASAPAGSAGVGQIMLPHYTNTTYYKSFISEHMANTNNTSNTLIQLIGGGQCRSTVATDTIFLAPNDGSNFIIGSSFSLYGIP